LAPDPSIDARARARRGVASPFTSGHSALPLVGLCVCPTGVPGFPAIMNTMELLVSDLALSREKISETLEEIDSKLTRWQRRLAHSYTPATARNSLTTIASGRTSR